MATRRRICRIWVLAENSLFLASASTRQKGHFRKYARLARLAAIRQTGEFSASTQIRQIRRRVAIAYIPPTEFVKLFFPSSTSLCITEDL